MYCKQFATIRTYKQPASRHVMTPPIHNSIQFTILGHNSIATFLPSIAFCKNGKLWKKYICRIAEHSAVIFKIIMKLF